MGKQMVRKFSGRFFNALVLVLAIMIAVPWAAFASEVSVASVVDTTAPTGSVTLAPGGSGSITINLSVTGEQKGTATFEVYRNWSLSGHSFSGSNPEEFTVAPRTSKDPATTFSTTGTVSVASGQEAGTFELKVQAFDITNTNTTGAKLAAGGASTYSVTVQAVAPAPDPCASVSAPAAPVISPDASQPNGSNGYFKTIPAISATSTTSDATISYATEVNGGTKSDYSSTAPILSQGTTIVYAKATSATCNKISESTATYLVDSISPSIADNGATAAPNGQNGWYTTEVTNQFPASDNGSGLADSTKASFSISSGTNEGDAYRISSGAVSDLAGNTNEGIQSAAFKIDLSAPSASLSVVAGTVGTNSWYTSDVTVRTSGSDSVSGPVSCTADQSQTTETTGQVFNGSCTNAAGLTTNAAPLTVKLDETGPSASLGVKSGTAGDNGWYTSSVVVGTTGADAISGPASCTADQSFSADTNGTLVNGSCTNAAGLSTNAASMNLKIDTTAPAIEPGNVNDTTWRNSSLSQDFIASDGGSGLAANQGLNATGGFTLTASAESADRTTATTDSKTVSDNAGNSSMRSLSALIDLTKPSVSAALSPANPARTGWYNGITGAPTVSYSSCSDSLSGLAALCPAPHTFGEGFDQSHSSGLVYDRAGNSNSAGVSGINVDTVAPTSVAFTGGPAADWTYYFGDVPAAPTCTADGGTSGLNSCVVTGYGTAVGGHTLTATATDNAGNTSTLTRSYSVAAWTLKGFYSPVDMGGVVNTVKGGSSVPMKFEVFKGSTELKDVSAVTSTTTQKIDCTTLSSTLDEIEATNTGSTSLRFDSTSDQFIFNWKTPTGTACYAAKVTTQDGSQLIAYFKTR